MKTILQKTKSIFVLLMLTGLIFSCSSDDDIASNGLEGVPKGEIVPVGERNEALTGFSGKSINGSQKWWSHAITKVTVTGGCDGDVEVKETGFFAFYKDGGLYVRTTKDGTPVKGGEWKWEDDNKDAVIVTANGNTQKFTVTYLNSSNVVYASVQTQGPCTATTYEQFNNPYN
ncbi:hypothetical protein WH52_04860 [Tenacibaculum holothuriorum]|uniref:Lipocalin-like domain-containing protein n=1 Tax=Tenacibaculum holothuriorum TaxID=1635173 RepID=A0A1Y2PER5_9FLAO|nr:hypothetical protein [Tenacibaculum holothuriorum]OSY88994.1 hypothetical protein WH52_04860 [Tenacibaculum holothuriorum]